MAALRTVVILAVVALLGAYIYTSLRGPQGLSALAAKREEIRSLQIENANLKQDIEAKAERIRQLKESQSEQELEIRKRMKLVKPGETVFIITDKPVPKPPPAPATAEAVPVKPPVLQMSPEEQRSIATQPGKGPAAKKVAKAKDAPADEKDGKVADPPASETPSNEVPPAALPKDPPTDQ
jgi:cell division protein FtsB